MVDVFGNLGPYYNEANEVVPAKRLIGTRDPRPDGGRRPPRRQQTGPYSPVSSAAAPEPASSPGLYPSSARLHRGVQCQRMYNPQEASRPSPAIRAAPRPDEW